MVHKLSFMSIAALTLMLLWGQESFAQGRHHFGGRAAFRPVGPFSTTTPQRFITSSRPMITTARVTRAPSTFGVASVTTFNPAGVHLRPGSNFTQQLVTFPVQRRAFANTTVLSTPTNRALLNGQVNPFVFNANRRNFAQFHHRDPDWWRDRFLANHFDRDRDWWRDRTRRWMQTWTLNNYLNSATMYPFYNPYSASYPGYSSYPSSYGSYPSSYSNPSYSSYPSSYGNYNAGSYSGYSDSDYSATTPSKAYSGNTSKSNSSSTLPTPPIAGKAAHVEVIVPDANAKVWFNGVQATVSGTTRYFNTPELTPATTYSYTVRAVWNDGDRTVARDSVVYVTAGSQMVVDFSQTPVQVNELR
jgi:uncharacterized protein (TIGR03000 family)